MKIFATLGRYIETMSGQVGLFFSDPASYFSHLDEAGEASWVPPGLVVFCSGLAGGFVCMAIGRPPVHAAVYVVFTFPIALLASATLLAGARLAGLRVPLRRAFHLSAIMGLVLPVHAAASTTIGSNAIPLAIAALNLWGIKGVCETTLGKSVRVLIVSSCIYIGVFLGANWVLSMVGTKLAPAQAVSRSPSAAALPAAKNSTEEFSKNRAVALNKEEGDFRRQMAVERLADIGGAPAVQIFAEILTQEEPRVSLVRTVIDGLGKIQSPAAIRILSETLRHPNDFHRNKAAEKLGEISGDLSPAQVREVANEMVQVLRKDSEHTVRCRAGESFNNEALGHAAFEDLADLAARGGLDEKGFAAYALSQVGDPRALPLLEKVYKQATGEESPDHVKLRGRVDEAIKKLRGEPGEHNSIWFE